ncbi:phage head-tail adapter protein [Pediococcus pentosaceus]|uniref:HK97-gp10 family putative phage morphogenesis protein n=1 Tax=Pediococcus pentosaceus TaxID=1255 RepID=UPI0021A411EA|nr:HK97-gp10 family putative phage morphogenesis protein [Pediococcus pentosaceus]MCT3020878.1 phage head-tail adapter protein [Pediococcus pentosaceus]MCT3023732.1 phage head-tail adapter protein [Pediococcus pentosaceus]
MDDFGKQLDEYMKNIKKLVPDTETRSKMTKAGADVYKNELIINTPRTKHKDVKYGHLRDNITVQNTDMDGERNGVSAVGFGKKAYVARFLNDGTKKLEATHFVDNARRRSTRDIFKAEQEVYEKNIKG